MGDSSHNLSATGARAHRQQAFNTLVRETATGVTVPKSRVRKKKIYTAPSDVLPSSSSADKHTASPRWIPGLAIALAVFGMAWLVVFYLTTGGYPVAALANWNIVIGFGAIVAALVVFTRWR